jgi:hypothetical protein
MQLLHVYENDPNNFEQVTALMQEVRLIRFSSFTSALKLSSVPNLF